MRNIFLDRNGYIPLGKNNVYGKDEKGSMSGATLNIRQNFQAGFTLIELMIVVAVIGILAAVAVANFIAYRDKARVASVVATTESIRGAQAAYAADTNENFFPSSFPNWQTFRSTMRVNGANLKNLPSQQGFQSSFTYTTIDSDSDSTSDDYYFVFRVEGVPSTLMGSQVEVRPAGIERQTYAAS